MGLTLGRGWAGLRLGCILAALLCAAPAAAQVAVVVHGPEDQEVARQLRQLSDLDVEERAVDAAPAGLGSVLQEASESSTAAYAVFIDRAGNTVHVLRLDDRTAAARVLTPDVMAESSYAVALAIAELLEWMAAVPAPRPLGQNVDLRGEDRGSAVPDDEGKVRGATLEAVVAVDVEVTTSPGYDLSLLRPAFALGLQWTPAQDSPWFGLGARLSAPANAERDFKPGGGAAIADVLYTSVEPAVTASIGIGASSAALVGQFSFGLSITDVEARDGAHRALAQSDATVPWLGLGLALRYPLPWGLSLSAGAEGQWLTKPGRYRVGPVTVLEEGPVRLATRLGLAWESAP